MIMLFLAADAYAIIVRIMWKLKTDVQEKQNSSAFYVMNANGLMEILKIRINGNRNVMNTASRRNRQKETEKNSKL